MSPPNPPPDQSSQNMERALGRVEDLLEQLLAVESLDVFRLEQIQSEWQEAVAAVIKLGAQWRGPRGGVLYKRLEQIVRQQLPATVGILSHHRSDIAQQLAAENRRFKTLLTEQRATSGEAGHLIRKA